jgi:hypothetical protein
VPENLGPNLAGTTEKFTKRVPDLIVGSLMLRLQSGLHHRIAGTLKKTPALIWAKSVENSLGYQGFRDLGQKVMGRGALPFGLTTSGPMEIRPNFEN